MSRYGFFPSSTFQYQILRIKLSPRFIKRLFLIHFAWVNPHNRVISFPRALATKLVKTHRRQEIKEGDSFTTSASTSIEEHWRTRTAADFSASDLLYFCQTSHTKEALKNFMQMSSFRKLNRVSSFTMVSITKRKIGKGHQTEQSRGAKAEHVSIGESHF